ncbi:MAG TPA: hypothetical protein VGR21_11840, partial [Cryptosporangiaceae bacterium]|nr:hypothetical protein [Cryptosporangiaceae bacterium]
MHRRSSQEYLEELRRARIAQLEAKARRRRRRVVALAVLSVLVACTTAVAIITVGVQRSRKTGSGSVPSTVLTPSPAATTAPGPTAQITGVGDVILGAAPQLPPENGATFFDGVRGQLTGDVVMGNLESPLTADTGVRKCPPPATPPPATPPPATPPPATPPP